VKKDGTRQEFDRDKVLKGLIRACEKRPVSDEDLSTASDEIESSLRLSGDSDTSSKKIGELVMKKLKKLDKVAYIRFASVYREFADVNDFNKEVQKLTPKKR
ncbi:transcriptional regulator NrdR, partial [Thermoproteota archaeon]